MSAWEVCQIVCETMSQREVSKGLFSATIRGIYRYEAQKATPSGSETIYSSDEFEYEWYLESGTDKWAEEEAKDKKAYNQVIAYLVSEGWEPVAIHPGGRISTMKRRIEADTSEFGSKPSDLLVQLSNLREAGIVTEEEFQAKKAEILKRM
jgi:hypothetical protein